jgi:hypothetical protein
MEQEKQRKKKGEEGHNIQSLSWNIVETKKYMEKERMAETEAET